MTLLDICELIVDCPHSTAKDEGQGYPLIRTPNIGKGRLILDDVHRVSKDVYDARNQRAVPQEDDLILAREAPVGNVAIIQPGQKVCLGQRTVLIRPDKSKVNPNYLVYNLLSPIQQHNLTSSANGATVAHLNMGIIRNLKMELPPRDVQDKIAGILSKYDELIENSRKQIALLEEAAQRLYREWFVDFRFPGSTSHNSLPQDWRKVPIETAFETVLGGTPSKSKPEFWNGDIPWINSGAVNLHRIIKGSEFITAEALKKSATKMMPKHTTVLAITGATLGQVSYTELEVCANQSVVGIIDKSGLYNEYIYLLITNEIEKIIAKSGGSAQQHINKNIINEYKITLPTASIVKQFKQIVNPYFVAIATLYGEIENLISARDALLPKLMSGDLKV